jgi:hypothetical protein
MRPERQSGSSKLRDPPGLGLELPHCNPEAGPPRLSGPDRPAHNGTRFSWNHNPPVPLSAWGAEARAAEPRHSGGREGLIIEALAFLAVERLPREAGGDNELR